MTSRFGIETEEIKSYKLAMVDAVCTQSGHILFSTRKYGLLPAGAESFVYAFDPVTSDLHRLDSASLSSLLLIDSARVLIAAYKDSLLTSYTLPPQYFSLPKCCASDL